MWICDNDACVHSCLVSQWWAVVSLWKMSTLLGGWSSQCHIGDELSNLNPIGHMRFTTSKYIRSLHMSQGSLVFQPYVDYTQKFANEYFIKNIAHLTANPWFWSHDSAYPQMQDVSLRTEGEHTPLRKSLVAPWFHRIQLPSHSSRGVLHGLWSADTVRRWCNEWSHARNWVLWDPPALNQSIVALDQSTVDLEVLKMMGF